MNILPLIIGFLLVFATIGTHFLRDAQALTKLDTHLRAAFKINARLHNTHMRRKYTQIAQVTKKPTKTLSSSFHLYRSRRESDPPTDPLKLSLTPLLDPQLLTPEQHPLYPVAARLIHQIYHTTPLASTTPRWEYTLLDALILSGKNSPKINQLSDLFPDDPTLRMQYYRMLKGTRKYTSSSGIPPFSDFFTIETTPAEAISFCFASPQLLEAIFNEKIALEIIAAEKLHFEKTGKHLISSREDLDSLLNHHPDQVERLQHLLPFIRFQSKVPSKQTLIGRDRITEMAHDRPLHKSGS